MDAGFLLIGMGFFVTVILIVERAFPRVKP